MGSVKQESHLRSAAGLVQGKERLPDGTASLQHRLPPACRAPCGRDWAFPAWAELV